MRHFWPTSRAALRVSSYHFRGTRAVRPLSPWTLTRQVVQRLVEWRGLERKIPCLIAVGPTRCDCLAGFIPRAASHALTQSAKSASRGGRSRLTRERLRIPATAELSNAPKMRGCRLDKSFQKCASSRLGSGGKLINSTMSARSRKSGLAVRNSGRALKTSGRVASKMASSRSL
jgi:hypothetical protein